MSSLIHSDPRESEVAALNKAAPHMKAMKHRIIEHLEAVGDDGAIVEDVPGHYASVVRRFTDLWKEGVIKPTDRTKNNKRGNPCTIWVIGQDENIPLFPLSESSESKAQTINRLRIENAAMREALGRAGVMCPV